MMMMHSALLASFGNFTDPTSDDGSTKEWTFPDNEEHPRHPVRPYSSQVSRTIPPSTRQQKRQTLEVADHPEKEGREERGEGV